MAPKTITASELAALLPSAGIAIIDVRDDDHIGGHIKGSTHVPSATFPECLPELVKKLEGKEVVVFHCALSQVRGPKAAAQYEREKKSLDSEKKGGESEGKEEQKVLVLKEGFVGWQSTYGSDERLTEAWRKELWEDY